MLSFSKSLILLVAATAVVGQGSDGFSDQCIKALAGLANNADASSCLAISQIPAIYANPDASVVQPVDNWLKAMCSAQPCSDSTLSTVVTTFIQGCPQEASAFGINSTSGAVSEVQKFYPPIRKAICLKHGDSQCSTESLSNYEKTVGTLTYSKLGSYFSEDPTSKPASVVCTDCNKAVYNIFIKTFGPDSDETNKFKQLCGDSFVDGQNPSGITGV